MIHAMGNEVGIKTINDRQFGFQETEKPSGDFLAEFSKSIQGAIASTNNDQNVSEELNLQMAVKPDSVNVHDVMIAEQKAQLSLDFTKSVLQRVISAYQNITNLR
jgi:flagellar hook-basal body complex protein FliE